MGQGSLRTVLVIPGDQTAGTSFCVKGPADMLSVPSFSKVQVKISISGECGAMGGAGVSATSQLGEPATGLLLLLLRHVSDSVRPHRRQPTRLPHPWDSPGKNTGVGCHFLLQCMKVKNESEVAQSCLTLSDFMDYSLPDSSIHGFSRQEYWSGVPLPSPKTMSTTQ